MDDGSKLSKRHRAIIGRWWDMTLLSLASMLVTLLIIGVISRSISSSKDTGTFLSVVLWAIQSIPTWVIPTWAASLTMIWIVQDGSKTWLRRLFNLPIFPPLALVALMAASSTLYLLGKSKALQAVFCPVYSVDPFLAGCSSTMGRLAFSIVIAALSVIQLARLLFRRKPTAIAFPIPVVSENTGDVLKETKHLLDWINDGNEVQSWNNDRFNHTLIAFRVARRLLEINPPAQMLLGDLGAGKSSVARMTESLIHDFAPESGIRFIRVELWPYKTPEAAVEGILRSLMAEIRRDVDLTGLGDLPSDYVEAISALGGFWAGVARILRGPNQAPEKGLERLSEIATAIEVRYVLWIEDLERFVGNANRFGEPETPEEASRLAPIRALIYAISRIGSITVVTATTSLYTRFDQEKIARYIERIPNLDENLVRDLLHTFRVWAFGVTLPSGGEIIDPAGAEGRKDLNWLNDHSLSMWRAELSEGSRSGTLFVANVIPRLCPTPRILKQGLRICLETWSRIPGEVDFDHLLVISLLRAGEPTAFAWLEANHAWIRSEYSNTDTNKPIPEKLKNSFNKLQLSAERQDYLHRILVYLFGREAYQKLPQGFASPRHGSVDYWNRIRFEEETKEESSDQWLLHRIVGADTSGLINLLEHSTSPIQVSRLMSFMVTFEQWGEMLKEWAKEVVAPGAPPWKPAQSVFGEEADTPQALWNLFNLCVDLMERNKLDYQISADAIRQALFSLVGHSISLTALTKYFFVEGSKRHVNPISNDLKMSIQNDVRAEFVRIYRDYPNNLVKSLKGGRSFCLRIVLFDDVTMDEPERRVMAFDGWSEIVESIKSALKIDPRTVIPALAHLVVRDESNSWSDFKYQRDVAIELFGDDTFIFTTLSKFQPNDWPGNTVMEALFDEMNLRNPVTG